MKIIKNAKILTQDRDNPYLENGFVVIKDRKILEVSSEDILKNYSNYTLIDAKQKLLMPGFINAHGHSYSAFARGINLKSGPFLNFYQVLEGLWWNLDKKLTLKDVKESAKITFMESLKNGVTTFFDHHASPHCINDSLFTISEAAKETKMKACLCYEVSNRDGEKIAIEGIKENVDFIKYCQKQENIKALFGLHASFTLDDKTLELCSNKISGLNSGYHIHVAESEIDQQDSIKKYNKKILNRFFDFNMLGKKTMAIHCVHIDEEEMDILNNTSTFVVHNPQSNMNNAVGTSRILKMNEKNIKIGMGTDGYGFDILDSLKTTPILQKNFSENPSVGFEESFEMLFENNSNLANIHFGKQIGKIKKGYQADIILVDYNPFTPLNKYNFKSHLLFGLSGSLVNTVIVDGEILIKDRKFLKLDEEKIYSDSRKMAKELWNRI